MRAQHWMVRAASGLALGVVGASASAQAVSLELSADQTFYSSQNTITLQVFALWDDDEIGLTPGVTPALAMFNFRIETGFGIEPTHVVFHPDLELLSMVDQFDSTGVEISGAQLPPIIGLPLNESNPILIATIECESYEFAIANVVHFEATTPPSVGVYNANASSFDLTIGDALLADGTVEVIVSGGPCCDEDPCNAADLAEPYSELNFDDVVVFLGAFSSGLLEGDLAEPFGSFDFSDVTAFLALFAQGCP